MQGSIPGGFILTNPPLPTDVEIPPDAESRDAAAVRPCELRHEFADAETAPIQKRKVRIAGVQQELDLRASEVVEPCAAPGRKGNCPSLRIRKNPDSVVVWDPNLVPPAFMRAVVTMPAYVWEALLQCLDLEERVEFEPLVGKLEFKPDKKAIGRELKNGTAVPGAHLRCGKWRLVFS